MTEWNPALYLRFEKERTQPAADLVARNPDLKIDRPLRVLELGCGTDSSIRMLAEGLAGIPYEITGIDSCRAMIKQARGTSSDFRFECMDIRDLKGTSLRADLIFSNACLQWLSDHERLMKMLMEHLNPGGGENLFSAEKRGISVYNEAAVLCRPKRRSVFVKSWLAWMKGIVLNHPEWQLKGRSGKRGPSISGRVVERTSVLKRSVRARMKSRISEVSE